MIPSGNSDDAGYVAWLSREIESTFIDKDDYGYPPLRGFSLGEKLVNEESGDD